MIKYIITIVIVGVFYSCLPKKQTAKEYKDLANDYIAANKLKRAIKALDEASKLDHKDPDIYVTMAEVYGYNYRDNYKTHKLILDTYNKAIHLVDWYEPVLLSRAHFYYNIGEYKDATIDVDSAISKNKSKIDSYLFKAKIFYDKKDTSTANKTYRLGLMNVPKNEAYKIYQDKAFNEFQLKLYNNSISDYLHELRLTDGVKFFSYCQLSWAYYNINKIDSACYYFELADKKWYNTAGVDIDVLNKLCKK